MESADPGTVVAPFTREQVEHLNCYQKSRAIHPFTCGNRSEHRENEGVLVATESGWHCPAQGCQYIQNWASSSMANRHWLPKMLAMFRQARDPVSDSCACGKTKIVYSEQ